MLFGSSRTNTVLSILTLICLNSCRPKKIAGTYILCSFNCQTLVLDDEQSFTEITRPEIGDTQKIKGYYEYKGRLLTLYTDHVDVYVDGIK